MRRPWLQIAPLGHLAIAVGMERSALHRRVQLSEEAVRIADGTARPEQPVILTAVATADGVGVAGRFDEAERWLDRAERTLHPGGEPAASSSSTMHAGLLRLAQGRLDEAVAALRAAERMQALLASKHPFALAARAGKVQPRHAWAN